MEDDTFNIPDDLYKEDFIGEYPYADHWSEEDI
jgi:hypothetical protein